MKHTLLAGAEVGRQLTDNLRNTGFFNNTTTSIQVPYDNPLTDTPVTFRQSATDANNHLRTNVAANYVQDQIELSRRIQILAGLRFDYFDLRFHNNRNADNLRRIDRLVSPRTGIVIKPVMQLSAYASYSVSYLPSSGDQFSSLTSITQQIKPEKFTNYEIGAKWDVRRDLTLTTAVYRQDRTNTRASDPNDPTRILRMPSLGARRLRRALERKSLWCRTMLFLYGISFKSSRNWEWVSASFIALMCSRPSTTALFCLGIRRWMRRSIFHLMKSGKFRHTWKIF